MHSRGRRLTSWATVGLGILLVAAGHPVPLPENTDQHYPFRAHSEFFYLAGLECAGAIAAFDPHDGPSAGWRMPPSSIGNIVKTWTPGRRSLGQSVSTTTNCRRSSMP